MFALGCGHEAAIRGDHIGRDQVVAGEPESPGEVADAATQGQAGDAGRRHDAAGRGEAERVRRMVEVAPRGAGIRARRLGLGIDVHAPHPREIDHQPAVVGPEPRRAVPAAAHGEIEPVLPGDVDRGDGVSDLLGLQHCKWTPIEDAVVHGARRVIGGVSRRDHRAAHLLAQRVHVQVRWCHGEGFPFTSRGDVVRERRTRQERRADRRTQPRISRGAAAKYSGCPVD